MLFIYIWYFIEIVWFLNNKRPSLINSIYEFVEPFIDFQIIVFIFHMDIS